MRGGVRRGCEPNTPIALGWEVARGIRPRVNAERVSQCFEQLYAHPEQMGRQREARAIKSCGLPRN